MFGCADRNVDGVIIHAWQQPATGQAVRRHD